MKLVAGYDRALAQQFFYRSVTGLLDRNEEFQLILQEEVSYLAERFSEFAAVPRSNTLAFPELFGGKIAELFQLLAIHPSDRRLLQIAETTASLLLFNQGFTALGGPLNLRKPDLHKDSRGLATICILYRSAAKGKWRIEREAFVLRHLARSAGTWVSLLGLIPGSDLLELIAARQTLLELPSA